MRPVAVPPEARDPSTQSSFRALYDSQFSFVWRCLRGMGVPESQLDDAAQEVFVVAHRRRDSFRGESSLRTWLYGILRNVAANQRRSLRRKGRLDELDPALPAADPSPEERLEQRERAEFVQRFLARLDDKKRDVFVLALLEQLAMPEVAEILGIPVDTAYTRLRTVREEFRRAIAKRRDPP